MNFSSPKQPTTPHSSNRTPGAPLLQGHGAKGLGGASFSTQKSAPNNHFVLSASNEIYWLARLNRLLLGIAILASATFGGLRAMMQLSPTLLDWLGLSVVILLWFGLVFANEVLLKTAKRLKETGFVSFLNTFLTGFCLVGSLTALLSVWIIETPILSIFCLVFGLQLILMDAKRLAFLLMAGSLVAVFLMHWAVFMPSLSGNMSTLISPGFSTPWLNQLSILADLFLIYLLVSVLGVYLAERLSLQTHQVETLQSLASTDALTRLVNRRQFNVHLNAEVARARRHDSPLSLALFDIDNFKHLNDHYGHTVGDRILAELGQLILGNIRESDIAARYGGEEFALILPETREKDASDLLERLRVLISQTVFCMPDNPLTLTVSIGLTQMNPRKATLFELIERADQALYEAKGRGKNQVYASSFGVFPFTSLKAGH